MRTTLLIAIAFTATAYADEDTLRKIFTARGFNSTSVTLPDPDAIFPVSELDNIIFKKIANFDPYPEGPSYRPSDDSYFFAGNVALTRVDPTGKLHQVLAESSGGGTHFLPDGSVLLVGNSGLRRIFPDGRVALLADGKETGDGNDLTVGKFGEVYFSAPGHGIYRLTPGDQGKLELVSDKGTNGLDVDPTGAWLYVVAGGVHRYPILAANQPLGERESVCRLPKGQGGGDGCTFDVWGNFYTMHFGSGAIRVIDPKRRQLIATIPTGVVPASNLTFGGPANTELFVTAGTPKHKNCQVLKAATTITGFCGHPGATTYREIRTEKQRADAKALSADQRIHE